MTVLTSGAAGNLREQILSAAASCFRERGIKATKMQEIAKRAGISVGNFYNYFENKDAIIDEFAQREVARLAREIDEIVNGRVSLEEQRRQFRESLRKQLAVQRARVKIEIIEEAARNSSMGEIVRRSDAQVRELIKKMHRSRSSADVSDEEIEVMVEMDMALVDGLEVVAVKKGKMADAGVEKGWIILQVNDRPMNTMEDFEEAVKEANRSSDRILWIRAVTQSGRLRSAVVELDEK